jgi:hypothetical protein
MNIEIESRLEQQAKVLSFFPLLSTPTLFTDPPSLERISCMLNISTRKIIAFGKRNMKLWRRYALASLCLSRPDSLSLSLSLSLGG